MKPWKMKLKTKDAIQGIKALRHERIEALVFGTQNHKDAIPSYFGAIIL